MESYKDVAPLARTLFNALINVLRSAAFSLLGLVSKSTIVIRAFSGKRVTKVLVAATALAMEPFMEPDESRRSTT